MKRMEIRLAVPDDLPLWQEVAKGAGATMRIPGMHEHPGFLAYATRKLAQQNALMAWDEAINRCAGFVAFSLSNNSVTWLAVRQAYKRHGVGSALLSAALAQLDCTRKISVNTYPENYAPGKPARSLYAKHGFVETISQPFVVDGVEMVELSLFPKEN